ncbi:MAG: UDP-2,3-diacylglucosamine diphosphatase [Planctomycetota bacterium]
MNRHDFRTVFISDTHLGSRGCQAEELAEFLDQIDCHTLYLVGDFIDFWNLRGKTYWPDNCNRILRRLLLMVEQGTRVIFVPGNHDEAARPYVGFQFGGIEIKMDDVHETIDGRRLFITHGDLYDMVVKNFRLLSKVGGVAYETLIRFNRWYNIYRRWRGMPKSSFSQTIKLKVKGACKFISAFEETLKMEAANRGMQGVVCGHVHKPELRADVAEGEVQYFNCGDWIEHCSALVEHYDGSMELIYAQDVLGSSEERAATVGSIGIDEHDNAAAALAVPDRLPAGAFDGEDEPAWAPAALAATIRANNEHARMHGENGDNAFHLEDWMAATPVTRANGDNSQPASGRNNGEPMTVADMFSTLTSSASSSVNGASANHRSTAESPGSIAHRRRHARGLQRWAEEDEHDRELAHTW